MTTTPIHMKKNSTTIVLLFLRLLLFACFQGIIALLFAILNKENAWYESQGFWIISGLLTNLVTFYVLKRHFKKRGKSYFENFKFIKKDWGKDIIIILIVFLISYPISMFPNTILANWLYGSEQVTFHLFFRPIPLWVIVIGFFWAITQGLVELPYYFAFIMPNLTQKLNSSWKPWLIASLLLALQHITLPFIFDFKFIVWRFGMFLLFALFVGLVLKLRPRLFPYLMIIHALMDIGAVAVYFTL